MATTRPTKLMRTLAATTAALAFGTAVAQTSVQHPLLNVNSGAMAYRSHLGTQVLKDSGKNPDALGSTSAFILDFERVLRTSRTQPGYAVSIKSDPNAADPNLRVIGVNIFRVHAAVAPSALDAEGASAPKAKVAAYVCAHQWNEATQKQNLVGTYQITYSGEVKPDQWDGPREAAKGICNPYLTARTGLYNQTMAQLQQPAPQTSSAGDSVDGPVVASLMAQRNATAARP